MFNAHVPKINLGDNIIIGLGDSYTQGVGAYTDESWTKHNNKIEVHTADKKLIAEQYQGSWVNQLCVNHLPGWVPVNMGHAGIGNRGSVKQLLLNTKVEVENAGQVVVVLLLSGLERFDFVRKEYDAKDHYSFEAMWPNPQDPKATNALLWKAYADNIYSEKFIAIELILNILEAQTYCEAKGYKFVFGSAFDTRANKTWLMKILCGIFASFEKENKKLIDKINWDNYIYPMGCDSFLQYLLKLENNEHLASGGWWHHYTSAPTPSEYISNCGHPTRKGHAVIAKLIYDFINED